MYLGPGARYGDSSFLFEEEKKDKLFADDDLPCWDVASAYSRKYCCLLCWGACASEVVWRSCSRTRRWFVMLRCYLCVQQGVLLHAVLGTRVQARLSGGGGGVNSVGPTDWCRLAPFVISRKLTQFQLTHHTLYSIQGRPEPLHPQQQWASGSPSEASSTRGSGKQNYCGKSPAIRVHASKWRMRPPTKVRLASCVLIWIRKVKPESRKRAVKFFALQGVVLSFTTYTQTHTNIQITRGVRVHLGVAQERHHCVTCTQ